MLNDEYETTTRNAYIYVYTDMTYTEELLFFEELQRELLLTVGITSSGGNYSEKWELLSIQ